VAVSSPQMSASTAEASSIQARWRARSSGSSGWSRTSGSVSSRYSQMTELSKIALVSSTRRSGTLPSGDTALNQSGLLAKVDIGPLMRDAFLGERNHHTLDVGAEMVADEAQRVSHGLCSCWRPRLHARPRG